MSTLLIVSGDLLLVLGLGVSTLSLIGLWRLPGLFARLHAVAKVGSVGLAGVLAATVGTGDLRLVARALVVAVVAMLTVPIATFAIARVEPRPDGEREPRDRSRQE